MFAELGWGLEILQLWTMFSSQFLHSNILLPSANLLDLYIWVSCIEDSNTLLLFLEENSASPNLVKLLTFSHFCKVLQEILDSYFHFIPLCLALLFLNPAHIFDGREAPSFFIIWVKRVKGRSAFWHYHKLVVRDSHLSLLSPFYSKLSYNLEILPNRRLRKLGIEGIFTCTPGCGKGI